MKNKILIVEDLYMNRKLLKDILSYYGYDVVEAENGEEAIRVAKEQKPDLIIMDLQMPVMNGFEAIKILKSDPLTKNIKVIALTSFAMSGDKENVFAAGFDEYLSKPLNTRELPELVEKMLKG